MKYGLHLPDRIETRDLIGLAEEAEEHGWDGFFYWDCDTYDAWIALGAIASRTERLRLGTFVTPLPRRNPYVVARQAAAIDRLSNGRFTLPVGLGVAEHEQWGFTQDYRVRAQMIDEGLEILEKWWSGEVFSFEGKHYQGREVTGLRPKQEPRIPVWVVGGKKQTQMRRARRWDGVLVHGSVEELRELIGSIEEGRESVQALDYVMQGETPGDDNERAVSIVREYAEVGVTWWLEGVWDKVFAEGGVEGIRRRIRQGPPKGV